MGSDIPQQLRNKFALPVADYRYCYQSATGGKSGKNDVLRCMAFLILLAIPVITFICFENLLKICPQPPLKQGSLFKTFPVGRIMTPLRYDVRLAC